MSTLRVAEIATVVHGYTIADIDRYAFSAVRNVWQGRSLDEQDRYDAAWFAIVEKLYTSAERPTHVELIWAGRNAVLDVLEQRSRHHGTAKRYDYQESPRFTAYWLHVASSVDDFTEGVAERLALPQVLSLLSTREYEAIAALAVHGDQRSAAKAIGITESAFNARIKTARQRINRAWFEYETPRTLKATKDHCRWGHLWSIHGVVKADGRTHCAECDRGRARRSARRRRPVLALESELEAEAQTLAEAN